MEYLGEHLLPGKIGHFFILLSLVASVVATISYYKSSVSKIVDDANSWKKLARLSFIIESVSILVVFSTLFYIIHNHYFEYKYAWQHSSKTLEFKYLLACFWEGQEGSTLLWSFWHCILGLVLIKTGKKWEAPVMTVISLAQVSLILMVAGLYIFDVKIGSSPFLLLRDSGLLDNTPQLHANFDINQPLRQDYLMFITDGNDLNVLLQNYWMVIHPPVLFLGFASLVVPFAFALAGLWKKQHDWLSDALPWALFGTAVLGIGIMMGAMWAYESLSFGGYWAWDPVENASLVPWLILVAGIHTLLIYKSSGYSLRTTYLFFILAFFFILYSTFLTKSGILGDTSVHAFADIGLNAQLYLLMYVFIWLSVILSSFTQKEKFISLGIGVALLIPVVFVDAPVIGMLSLVIGIALIIRNINRFVPSIHQEENSSSREFWMFIGALVLFLSGIVIISQTSLPVVNKLFGTDFAMPEDIEYAYNSIQIYVAIIIAVLSGFSQYLKYKQTNGSFFWKKMLLPLIASIVISGIIFAVYEIRYTTQGPMFQAALWLTLFCSVYAVVANFAYIFSGQKGKLKLAGGSIAHFGFGLVLIGVLFSSGNKEVLSINTSGIMVPLDKEGNEKPGENLTLIKGVKMDMGEFWVTYAKDEQHPVKPKYFFHIDFERKDGSEKFTLIPNAFKNLKSNDLQANPDARHYWSHDIFAYITSYLAKDKQVEDTANFTTHNLRVGDSVFYSTGFILFDSLVEKKNLPVETFGTDGKLYEAKITAYSKNGSSYTIRPNLAIAKGNPIAVADTIISESLAIKLDKVLPDQSIELGVKESDSILEYITLKVYKYPFIRILWGGVVLTALGLFISMARRIRLIKQAEDKKAD